MSFLGCQQEGNGHPRAQQPCRTPLATTLSLPRPFPIQVWCEIGPPADGNHCGKGVPRPLSPEIFTWQLLETKPSEPGPETHS